MTPNIKNVVQFTSFPTSSWSTGIVKIFLVKKILQFFVNFSKIAQTSGGRRKIFSEENFLIFFYKNVPQLMNNLFTPMLQGAIRVLIYLKNYLRLVEFFCLEKSLLFGSINHSLDSSWFAQHFLSWVSWPEIRKSWSKKSFFDVRSKFFK